jgi:REP-associated tyrosine transposase
MARPLRLEFEFALWHLTSRGNERKDIFRDDIDRERFIQLLRETVVRFGWRLLAFVLMSNHYHLVVQTPETNLSRGMHWLNGRYAQYFNRRHDRCGHLFQGRFKGILVEKQSHLLTLARYLVLNPVRAGMVSHPAEWRWSSYRQTAGLEPSQPWLATDDLLEQFGSTENRLAEYVHFVDSATPTGSPWTQLVGQIFLGSPDWLAQIGDRIASRPRSEDHPRAQLLLGRPALNDAVLAICRTFDITPEQLCVSRGTTATARMLVAVVAFDDCLARQSDIAAVLGLGARSSVASLVRRGREALERSDELRQLLHSCRASMPRRPPPSALLPAERMHFYDERRWFRPPRSRSPSN